MTDAIKLADEIQALAGKATPTPWEADSEKDDNRVRYAVMLSPEGHSMFDSMNTDYRVGLIETESDGEFYDQWDEVARRNFDLIAKLVNNLPAIVAALRSAAEKDAEIGKLRSALEKIERWQHGDFPDTGRFWPNADGTMSDRPMSYGACYGANGERDSMRELARAALTEKPDAGGGAS